MSVGVQRLRDEPERIRQGAIDKREDPSLVDRAIEADAERRRLQSESDQLKAERNTASKQIGETIRGGATPDGPEVAELRARSTAAGAADRRHRRRAGGDRAAARGPAPAHPEPGRPRGPGRRRGGERHRPHLGRAGRPRGDRRGRRRPWTRRPHWELGESLGDDRQRARREGGGLGVPGLHGRRQPAPAQPHQLVPRRPHDRARLHRGLAAGRRQHGERPRDRPDPGQGRPDVRRHPRRAVPGPHGRGPGHQPAARRDPRGGPAARPVRGLHAVLAARGGRRRQGHPGHPPRPPVRQGRDGAVREARGQRRGARVDDRRAPRSCSSGWGCRTACC